MGVGRQSGKCRCERDGANTALAQSQLSLGDHRQGSRRCHDSERAAAARITSDAPEGGMTRMDERCDRGGPSDCYNGGGIELDVMEADVALR